MIARNISSPTMFLFFPDYLWYEKATFVHREGAIWFWEISEKKLVRKLKRTVSSKIMEKVRIEFT